MRSVCVRRSESTLSTSPFKVASDFESQRILAEIQQHRVHQHLALLACDINLHAQCRRSLRRARSRAVAVSLSVTMVLASLVRSTPSSFSVASSSSAGADIAGDTFDRSLAVAGDIGRQLKPRRGELAQRGDRGRPGAGPSPASLSRRAVRRGSRWCPPP